MTDSELVSRLHSMYGVTENEQVLTRTTYEHMTVTDSWSKYSVYVQINIEGYVTAVDSDAFLTETASWYKVDEGSGELYKYARVNYCPAGLVNDYGTYNYKLVDYKVVYAPQSDQPSDQEILMTLMGVEE